MFSEKQLGYARAVVAEGRRQGVTERGLIIGLATVLVECDLIMYANAKVPESLKLPHDRVGSDGKSVGLFQQQVVLGNGAWWWGDAATCMDPTSSARLFFERLRKLDYNNTSRSPGRFAQDVQKSAYPTRYDERMGQAAELYRSLTPAAPTPPPRTQEGGTAVTLPHVDRSDFGNRSNRWGARVRLFVLHTEEGNSNATQLEQWMKRNEVSYHYISDPTVVVDHVDTDFASWSVLDANPYCINWVFAGSKASWSTEQWMRRAPEIDEAARTFVIDAGKYDPLVPVVIGHGDIRAGKAGGTDHFGITKGIGIGTHTDCGPNFPWGYYAERVAYWAANNGVPVVVTPPPNEIDLKAAASPWLGDRVTVGEITPADGRGRIVHFANGSVYWTPTTGARPIPAALFEKFAELNYEHTLGYPVTDHVVLKAPDGADWGDVQSFENGWLYRRYGRPGFWVHGAIGARWARTGFENGPLGWPTTDEQPQSDGSIIQTFERGRIFWSPDGVTVTQPTDGPDVVVPDRTH